MTTVQNAVKNRPFYDVYVDVNGTITNRPEESDALKALANSDIRVIKESFFPSFINALIALSEGQQQGKLDYRITVISYCRIPEHFPLTVQILSKLFGENFFVGIIKDNNIIPGKVEANEGECNFSLDDHKKTSLSQSFAELQKHKFVILRGDFEAWRRSGFASQSGKPFYVAEGRLPVFFDDNLIKQNSEGTVKYIVHPMTPAGGTISFEKVERLCVQVDPVEAEKQSNYFINKINSIAGNTLLSAKL